MVTICILVIILMRVLQSVYHKRASMELADGLLSYVSYVRLSNVLSTAFALLTMCIAGQWDGCNGQMLLIATASGICLALSTFSSMKSLLGGTLVLNSIFGTAGLIVPCILGIFVFDEPISLVQTLCIVAVLISTVLLVGSAKDMMGKFDSKTLFYLILTFLSNGMVMFCQKLFGYLQPQGNVAMFSMFTFLVPAVVLSAVLLWMRKPRNGAAQAANMSKKLVLYTAILAFAVFVIQQLVTMLTPLLSGALLFTWVNGSSTVIAAIVGALVYKEKLSVKSVCGVVLGIGAMILMKMV